MWINFEKKLIYLCNPKCGSSKIRIELEKQNFICGKIQGKMNVHNNHSPMKFVVKYLELLGENPNNFTYFTIVREPLKRLISNFNYCRFDLDWHAFYSSNRDNALLDFSKEYDFTYKGKYNYTINDYLSFGLEATSNLCTSPMPIIQFTEISNKNLNVFKLENLSELKDFLQNYDISLNIEEKENCGEYEFHKIISTITKENLEKIYKIYEYEYTNYYKISNLLHYFDFCKNIKN